MSMSVFDYASQNPALQGAATNLFGKVLGKVGLTPAGPAPAPAQPRGTAPAATANAPVASREPSLIDRAMGLPTWQKGLAVAGLLLTGYLVFRLVRRG